MIEALRRIEHGGPADPDRVEGIAGTGEEFSFLLKEGRTFLDAVTMPLVERGFQAAALRIVDADWEPLVYALPALAEDRGRVFRYSDPITARGGARIEMARAVFGRTDLPVSDDSPKKFSGPRMAITASLPRSDTTLSLTLPVWM